MPRARNIKPGFFANEKLAELEPLARLLFAGLWTVADREGRLEDRPKRIKAQVLPYDECDIDGLLSRLEGEFIQRYEVGGERYISVVNWAKHQKPHHMELPSAIPPADGCSNRYNHSPISKAQRNRIINRDGGRCVYCSSNENICIDHKVPVSKGGTSDDENLQVLCAKCNGTKGNKEEHIVIESCTERERAVNESYTSRERVVDESCTSRGQVVQNGSCPTDSLNLIPDSLNLIPFNASPRGERKESPCPVFPGGADALSWFEGIFRGEWNSKTWRIFGQEVNSPDLLGKLYENAPMWMRTRKYRDGFGKDSIAFLKSGCWHKPPSDELMGNDSAQETIQIKRRIL